MTDENLIKKAATAIRIAGDQTNINGRVIAESERPARAALAVFEEAHAKPLSTSPERVKIGADSSHVAPADDERIVRASIHGDVDAIRAFDRLVRRTEVPEPGEHECSWACGVDKHGRDGHAEPQGQPTDEACEADWGPEGQESPCRCGRLPTGDACLHESFTSFHVGRGMVRMTCHDCGETGEALSATARADIDERSAR